MPTLVLFQPDIAGNAGTILRLGACLGLGVEIVEPAGFDLSDRNLRRAGMDYLERASLTRHVDWDRFEAGRRDAGRRLVLLTTAAERPYTSVRFRPDDAILFGRESAGVPPHVHEAADLRARIPMEPGARSLNLAISVAMVAGEALRQLRAGAERDGRTAGEPRLGAGAAILRGGRLLLIRRRNAPDAGAWGLPGGKVDPFETVAGAAEREIREEVGLSIRADTLLCVADQIDREADEHWFAPVYLVTRFEGEPAIAEPNKHDGLGWFAPGDLPDALTAPTRAAVAALAARPDLFSPPRADGAS